MILQGYDTNKILAARGEKIKVMAAGKYRLVTVLGCARRKGDGALLIKGRMAPTDMPWGTHLQTIDYYNIAFVRKADKIQWLPDKETERIRP